MTKVGNNPGPAAQPPQSPLLTPPNAADAKGVAGTSAPFGGAISSKKPNAGKPGTGAADVKLSDDAIARQAAAKKAFDIAKGTPDVREDRVAALKAQIQAGTYKVDSGDIADGMLREAIKEHLAETEER